MEDDCAPEDQPLDRGSTEAPQPTSLLTAGHFSLSLPVNGAVTSLSGRKLTLSFGVPFVKGSDQFRRPVPASISIREEQADGAGLVLAGGEGGPPPPPPPMPPSVSSAPSIIDSGAKRGRSPTSSPAPCSSFKAPRGPSPTPAPLAAVPVPQSVPTPSSSASSSLSVMRRPKPAVNEVLTVLNALSEKFLAKRNPSRGLLELPQEAKGERPVNVMDFFCKPLLVGQGGFGQAYEVVRKDNGKFMVLKLVLAATKGDGAEEEEEWEFTRSFMREMRAVHALASSDKPYREYVVEHLYYGMCEESIPGVKLGYMAMPRAVGSLSDYLHEVDETTLLRHVARGLTCLHSHNLVHGDIKDGNVLVFGGPDDAIFKVSDLGNCRLIDQDDLTAPGPSILYCSPQQLLRWSEDQTSAGSDVWNFAVWAASRRMGEGGSLFAPLGASIVSLLQRSVDGHSQGLLVREIMSLYETPLETASPVTLFNRLPKDEALRLKNDFFIWLANRLHFMPEERGSMEEALEELEALIAEGAEEAGEPSIFQR